MQHTQTNLQGIKDIVNQLVDFVKPTYGPNGKKVLIKKGESLLVLDDGVRSARAFTLPEFDGALLQLIKETSEKTSMRVKDGTTGSLILLKAIINNVQGRADLDLTDIKQALIDMTEKVESEDELYEIAKMAYNDEAMARLIAKLVKQLGPDAVIALQESPKLETTWELREGMQVESGYASPYMQTSEGEAVWERTPVLVTDRKIQFGYEVKDLCELLIKNGHNRLVIFADNFENDTLSSFAENNMTPGGFKILAVRIPGVGDRKADFFSDLGACLGIPVFSKQGTFSTADLAMVEKIVATKDTTTIYGNDKAKVAQRIAEVRGVLDKEENEFERYVLQNRIARLGAGIAVIKVGGLTSSEMRAVKYKAENAISSTKLALKSGVVPGAGVALASIKTNNPVFNKALKAPAEVLKENGGKLSKVSDPVDVVIASLESAVSIASLLLSLCGIIIQND